MINCGFINASALDIVLLCMGLYIVYVGVLYMLYGWIYTFF